MDESVIQCDPEANVVSHGAGEEERVLQHHAVAPPQFGQVHVADVDAVDANRALLHVVEAQQQRDDGGLARAGVADDRDRVARIDGERNIAQHPVVVVHAQDDQPAVLSFSPLAAASSAACASVR